MKAARGRRGAVCARVMVISLVLGTALSGPARADPEYPLLMNKLGELCTMCEAVLGCAAGKAPAGPAALAAPDATSWTVYHFRTKTFWGQVATIGDFFVRWFRPVNRETRPVDIYVAGQGSAPGSRRTAMAALSRDPPVLDVGEARIDRVTGAWQAPDGGQLGSCARLPLKETLEFLDKRASWTPIETD